MCIINLQQIMKNKTYPESGLALFEIMVDKMKMNDKIVIDLDGVVSMPSMFLNTSIGKFIEQYGVDVLREKVSFSRISSTQADRLKLYINRVADNRA